MRINGNDEYCGITLLILRMLLKKSRDDLLSAFFVQEALSISSEQAVTLIKSLLKDNYIEEYSLIDGVQYFTNTSKGNALSMASAAQPLKRETANRKISEFLKRVEEVNTNSHYLYSVEEVSLFGSLLSKVECVSDIDIAVRLAHKIEDPKERREADNRRCMEAMDRGRVFSNFVDGLLWSRTEVLLFLKSRSRGLSLHDTEEDDILKQTKSRIIYQRV